MPTFTDPANIWMSSLICRLGAQTGKRKRPQQKASNNQQSGDESKRKWGIKEENKDSKQKQEASKSSSAMEQSKTNSELEKAQGTVVSEYELFRIDKIECNNKKMEELGIRKHEKSGSSSEATGLVAKAPHTTTRGHDDKYLAPAHSSPTRYHAELQCQQILVVLGSELHCSDPRHPESHNVHFPLNSSQDMSAVVYPGTCPGTCF